MMSFSITGPPWVNLHGHQAGTLLSVLSLWKYETINCKETNNLLISHLCWSIVFFYGCSAIFILHNIDVLLQERHNSNAITMELHLSCTNPSIKCMYHCNILWSLKSQHGGWWWPGTKLVPGHQQPSWWCRPVNASQWSFNLMCLTQLIEAEWHIYTSVN